MRNHTTDVSFTRASLVAALSLAGAASSAQAQWSDNFDTYAAGPLGGNGGWAVWCSGGVDGAVNTDQAHSGKNSFRADATTDMVQTFTGYTSGQWIFSCMTYVPVEATGIGAMVVLNQYPCPTANQQWSISTNIDADAGVVMEWNGATVALVKGAWVEYRLEIDLDADTFSEFYNGEALVKGGTWSANIAPGGIPEIQALDLFSQSMNGMYYDTISLTSAGSTCTPDCDGSGTLNIDDFICFQTLFALGDPAADCDGNGSLNIDDFICFQTFFAIGC